MSAFVVHNDHINAILNYCYDHARIFGAQWRDVSHLTQVGQTLLNANVASVNYRYRENDDAPVFRFRPKHCDTLGAVDILKMLSCLEYQSCELPDWDRHEAYRIIESLRVLTIHTMPGYNNAPWEFTYDQHAEEINEKRLEIRARMQS